MAVPADTIRKLGLSDAQKTELARLETELDARVGKARKAKDAAALKGAYRRFRRELDKMLTEEQRVRWEIVGRDPKHEEGK